MPDFPQTTGLIDNFNRADEGPPPTGWTEGYSADHGSVAGWKLSGNKAVANNPASELLEYCYWNARQYSGDVEVYLDVVQAYTGGTNIEIGIHVTNPTSATHSGYNVVLDATGGVLYRLRCYRVDNGVDTQLGSTISRLGFTPLRFGVRRTGSTIDVYTDEGSGWVLRGSFTDATYNSGYIEIGLGGQHQVDNIYAAAINLDASASVQLASLITNAQAAIETSPQLVAQLAQANLSATAILSPGPIAALEATLGNATLTAQAGIETWISATPQLAALLLNAQGSPTLASGADGYRSIRILTDASLVRFSGNEMRAAGKNRVFVTTETNHAQ